MYSQFLCNVNTGLLMIILPLLVGLVSLIVSKLRNFSEDGMKKIRKVCFLAVGEYTFVGLVSISTMVGVSLSI